MNSKDLLTHHWFSKWLDHIDRFMRWTDIYPQSGVAWCGLSGGRDSVMLLWTLWGLRQRGLLKEVKAVHINHGGRPECQLEEQFARQICQQGNIDLTVYHLSINRDKGNFEKRARDARYECFARHLSPGERFYLAHQLDDSFEWSLLSKFKSGNLKPQLGMAVVNGAFARPFLSVSRDQITRMLARLKLPYRDDPSNEDTRHERNFLRHNFLVNAADRFPGYLRHYVVSSNQMAKELGLWRPKPGASDFVQKNLPLSGVGLFHPQLKNNFQGAESRIRKLVEGLSSSSRGVISDQVEKLISAQAGGKRGPLLFSGQVEGYLEQGEVFLVAKKDLNKWRQYDQECLQKLQQYQDTTQIPEFSQNELREALYQLPYPGLVYGPIDKLERLMKCPRQTRDLMPKTTEYCLQKRIWFGPLTKLLVRCGKVGYQNDLPLLLVTPDKM